MSIFELYDVLRVGMGYNINDEAFRLELYKLLSYVVGDKAVCSFAAANPDCSFTELRDDFLQDEVINLLISTAIKGRLYDEQYDFIFEKFGGECGVISLETGQQTKLTLREAFNKIIHSHFHLWDKEYEVSGSPLKLSVRLYGEHRGVKWEAVLDILKYVHYCAVVTNSCKTDFLEKQIKWLNEVKFPPANANA